MKRERADEELSRARKPGALARRLGRGTWLPRDLRSLLRSAVGEDGALELRALVMREPTRTYDAFDGISERAVRRLVRKLLPSIADATESAWRALERRPFGIGAARRPFRCTPDCRISLGARGSWLLRTAHLLGEYDRDITWVATYAGHVRTWGADDDIGWLLAGALDLGSPDSDAVLRILQASATGEHEVATMGRHVIRALLGSSRPEAWEFVEHLLLAARRQEGLRQSILEAADESHPEAFRHILRSILEHDLCRFSSVVRAADTWFGYEWGAGQSSETRAAIETALGFLEDPSSARTTLGAGEPGAVHLALWSLAFVDVGSAIPAAAALLEDERVERRFVATHFLAETQWKAAWVELCRVLNDPHLRVAATAVAPLSLWVDSTLVGSAAVLTDLEKLRERVGKRKQEVEPLVWPWCNASLEMATVSRAIVRHRRGAGIADLRDRVAELETHERLWFLRELAGITPPLDASRPQEPKRLEGEALSLALLLIGDRSQDVREGSFDVLANTPIGAEEIERLIELLRRKSGNLRNRCIRRLLILDESARLDVARRLIEDSDAQRRLAGLELLQGLAQDDRHAEDARAQVRARLAGGWSPDDLEAKSVERILGEGSAREADEPFLGLVDLASVRAWPDPREREVELHTPAARACVEALCGLILRHRDEEVPGPFGGVRPLLDTDPSPWTITEVNGPEVLEDALPLAATWRDWFHERGEECRDQDGLELVRAVLARPEDPEWEGPAARNAIEVSRSVCPRMVRALLRWGIYWEQPRASFAFLVDGFEDAVAALTDQDFRELAIERPRRADGRRPARRACDEKFQRARILAEQLDALRKACPSLLEDEERRRSYALRRWVDARASERGSDVGRLTGPLDFVEAHRAGLFDGDAARELTHLIVDRLGRKHTSRWIGGLTRRKAPAELADSSELVGAIDRIRRRVVELECERGDRETSASRAAVRLSWSGGLEVLAQALPALGRAKFARGARELPSVLSRKDTLSHLVFCSAPRDEDTRDAFADWIRDAKVPQGRLLELATYAPQWAEHVDHVLEWPGLVDAVWWLHAHTKENLWLAEEQKLAWAAAISERTPLIADDLVEGAVDVPWFTRAFRELGIERWRALSRAAEYASTSGGHKRAELFANAMIGEITREQILERISDKRHQDSVRALGLVPLATGSDRPADLLDRYRRLQAFQRESRAFGSQRQQSERRAAAIALDNLARTANFEDPLRLQWAMEQEALGDLAKGPVRVAVEDVELQLSIDGDGKPVQSVTRAGRKLKSVPAKLRKDAAIVEFKARVQELRRQSSRVASALEHAMVAGATFRGAELQQLLGNPILAPSLSRLVFVGAGRMGYPAEDGRALVDHAGGSEPVDPSTALRIAHPHDLLASGDWPAWQHECFARERIQPFKQVFRELYPVTASELDASLGSRRYAGHQVNPRQALALLRTRGWTIRPGDGVSNTSHSDGVTAFLGFDLPFYTPAEIEGLTLESVGFTKRGSWTIIEIADVPPRFFSETMRDIDLVVSVAHCGGVDPEACASTVEMRAALVRESCRLLDLPNVQVRSQNVIVEGSRATYSIHLGSGVAAVLGGPILVIVAVHSQHRGRLFLPFADDDPRTAEVLSKVLLLARDEKIQDPSILAQIRDARL